MSVIEIVGLGPGDYTGLPLGTLHALKSDTVLLRTRIHPVVERIEKELGRALPSCDDLYETIDDFSEVYRRMAERVVDKARTSEHVVYAVPGHPLVAEQSVQNLLAMQSDDIEVSIGPGQSFLDVACSVLRIDPIEGLSILDGTRITGRMLNSCIHIFIAQVYQSSIAADVKLTLMESYPDDYEITVVRAAGVAGEESIQRIPLYELDRLDTIDHLTTVYVPPVQSQLERVRDPWESVDIVARLRAPDGCPWDRKQTHESLRKYVIEEAFEVAEAIDEGDPVHLAEELGDLLLQTLLHAQIAEEFGDFSIRDVFGGLAEKLLRRHPHVFGEVEATSVDDANAVWDAVKADEAFNQANSSKNIMENVNLSGPSLMVATDVQKAAAKVGFDWNQVKDVLDKVKEEMNELEAEFSAGVPSAQASEELGDLLFACVNLSRALRLDAEALLAGATRKFMDRFSMVESAVQASSRNWKDYTVEELDELWKKAKIEQRHKN